MRKLFLLALACSSPALGCEIDTPTAWLPGFTEQQVEDRQSEILTAWSNVRSHQRTESLVASAPIIYLARVTKAERDDDCLRSETTLEPLKSIKGKMPASRRLQGGPVSSCGTSKDDGEGARARVGELVVVFEGLQTTDDNPRGIDSVRMISVLSGSLLDPVQEWLSTQPDSKPYD